MRVTFPRTRKNSDGRRRRHAVSRGRICWCLLVSEDVRGRVTVAAGRRRKKKGRCTS